MIMIIQVFMMIMMVQMPMMMVIMNNLLEKSIALPLFSHHTLLGCTLLGPPGHDDVCYRISHVGFFW